ncbi:alpha/beta hydrolase family protein [Bryocella elongata]|nr:acetylxylan esterase [Bryocella elongata]
MSDRFSPRARFASLLLMPLLLTHALHGQTAKPVPSPGRESLNKELNALAAKETAARRAKVAAIASNADAEARQHEVRATMLRLLGPLPGRTPLNAQVTGSTQLEGFRVDRVLYESQPKFYVTALLYVPDRPNGSDMTTKFPAIVMAPGHAPSGKAGDVAFAEAFARAGFVVLSWDPFGQGERLQYPDPQHEGKTLAKAPTGEHGEAGLQPTLLGNAIAQYMLWDGMRAVDYLTSLPEVDSKRIGAFGCSGGGTDTALLGALDTRVAAIGVACYITSFDALLPSLGPQDAEQSIPNFIASGLDLPDWVEVAAPRPYAIISTTEDMFPFAGATTSEAEAQKFYAHLGADTNLTWIKGPGHHGNLRPILPQILAFFTAHLHPDAAYAKNLPPITDPFTTVLPVLKPTPPDPKLTQVTPTGQVATSYPDAATVFTLNRARAEKVVTPHPKGLLAMQQAVRSVTHAMAIPGSCHLEGLEGSCTLSPSATVSIAGKDIAPGLLELTFTYPGGSNFHALLGSSALSQPKYGKLLLTNEFDKTGEPTPSLREKVLKQSKEGGVVLAMQPRPSPQGNEESKAGVLGEFYLTELRAELTGRTLIGLRVDDTIVAANYLATLTTQHSQPAHTPRLAAEASGHYALVLLHAAVLDTRLKSVLVLGEIINYRDLIADPMPRDAPEDILPGVLKHYDVDDLYQAVGTRLVPTK